ncbi:MAG: 2-oxoacid:acceptor oxidoreductase family protein [Candidatus Omnitrophica bacterium]|nr:2-oxoacid:acceptor oxidoreductase family protein [Candidatus Omnitrophota bacterium]
MIERIIIAGAGGQGIMLMGKVLAEAAMKEDKFVTWLPAYGAEVRGGTAHCMITISDNQISSPVVSEADSLIVMNAPSLVRFRDKLKKNGLLIINSSLAAEGTTTQPRAESLSFSVPLTDIALELGNIKVANIVALGFFIAKTAILDKKNILATIEDMAPKDRKDLIEINKKAFLKGMELMKEW